MLFIKCKYREVYKHIEFHFYVYMYNLPSKRMGSNPFVVGLFVETNSMTFSVEVSHSLQA